MTLTPPTEFTITITMASDWHVGSGSGRGEIDSVVQRDSDGLPYIPAKTLTGILRDGCEQVAQALDSGNRSQWHDWINFLFGDQPTTLNPGQNPGDREQLERMPRPAALGIRSARFRPDFRQAMVAKPALKSAIAFMKPGVAIDAKTGAAKPDFLRVEEVVRMDAVLIAEHCTLDFSETPNLGESEQKVAYALLIAGAQMVERLGGKRRRGNGRCTVNIDAQWRNWLQFLKDHHNQVVSPPPWQPSPLTPGQSSDRVQSTTWYRLSLTIHTESPLVLPARTVGNVVESLDHIPGRYLLRHLHRALEQDLDVGQAIARGDLVITNATVAIEGQAGRPTPLCLFGEKLAGGLSQGQGLYNRFQEAEPPGIQLKGERSGYVGPFNRQNLPAYQTVKLALFTHNTISDPVQRPTSDLGGVYSYQAIPEGTVLKAELRLPEPLKGQLDADKPTWWKRLNGRLRIGQSKKDQYGAIRIEAAAPAPVEPQASPDKGAELYVWCLSDVLLRDPFLRPTTDPAALRVELASQLGVTLEDQSTMVRSRRTDAWQVRWGLPRASMLGFQAGSCMVYRISGDPPTPEKLAELAAKGIGDRCAEGYGQICFNDPLLTTPLQGLTCAEVGPQAAPAPPPQIRSGDHFAYARSIERAAWREAIQNQALAIATSAPQRQATLGLGISAGGDSQPSMSQLGGLRSVMGRLTTRQASNPVTQWIVAVRAVTNRQEKWPKGSLEAIEKLVKDFNWVWTQLGFEPNALAALTVTANGEAELKTELWAEAVRTLVDAMIRAHKRDWEKSQPEEAA
jgi:CRISPR-associated protein Csx10